MRDADGPFPLDTPPAAPAAGLVRRVEGGACVREMMRRGEIGGQALGLLQLVAACGDRKASDARARASEAGRAERN